MRSLLVVAAIVATAGCGSGSNGPMPLVDQIPEAIAAMNATIGDAADLEYFEISADLTGVTLVLAEHSQDSMGADTGSFATSYRWENDVLEQVGETASAEGATFLGSMVDLDAASVFAGIEAELDDPTVVDLAVQGDGNGGIVIDVSVENDKGGRLLVLIDSVGRVLGVQAA